MRICKCRINLAETGKTQYIKTRSSFKVLDVKRGGRLNTPFLIILEDIKTPLAYIPVLAVTVGNITSIDRTWTYVGTIEGTVDGEMVSIFYKNEALK